MKIRPIAVVCCSALAISTVAQTNTARAVAPAKQPNILIILADDLGYGSPGCYGNVEAAIPANTIAILHVPARDAAAVTEGGNTIRKVDGVRFLRMEKCGGPYRGFRNLSIPVHARRHHE